MKKQILYLFVLGLTFSAHAGNGLWTDGADAPDRRVNANLKVLSPQAYRMVAESVSQAVVNISTTKIVKGRAFGSPNVPRDPRNGTPFDDFFDQFFGRGQPSPFSPQPEQDEKRPQGLGSGFVIHEDGYIVTNNHVIDSADEIKVVFSDETELPAKVVGKDVKTDVALLKVEPKKKLKTVILGDSSQINVGDIAVAIGNPFGLSQSVTQGIISAKERSIGTGHPYDDFLQTDTSINPGNSGGPLLNIQAEVIGINTAILSNGQGIGFAIPINLAKNIVSKLKKDGKVIRGWIGVVIQKVTEDLARALKLSGKEGALVLDLQKSGPADKAGIQRGDVIVEFDGKKVKDQHELPFLVADVTVGKTVKVVVIRNASRKTLEVKVEELVDQTTLATAAENLKGDELGLVVENLTRDVARALKMESTEGVLVTYVDPKSPAASVLRRSDVILEINQKKIESVADYKNVIKAKDLLILVRRGGGNMYVVVQAK